MREFQTTNQFDLWLSLATTNYATVCYCIIMQYKYLIHPIQEQISFPISMYLISYRFISTLQINSILLSSVYHSGGAEAINPSGPYSTSGLLSLWRHVCSHRNDLHGRLCQTRGRNRFFIFFGLCFWCLVCGITIESNFSDERTKIELQPLLWCLQFASESTCCHALRPFILPWMCNGVVCCNRQCFQMSIL